MKIRLIDKPFLIKAALFAAVSITIIAQISTLVCTIKLLKASNEHQSEDVSSYAIATPMLSSDAIYRLYECGGKIGIYDAKSDILVDIIDVFASSLPDSDRQALKKGIEIYSFNELSKIIDDFSS